MIKDLERQGARLDHSSIVQDADGLVSRTIHDRTGKMVGRTAFVAAVEQHFGNWTSALEAAGLEVRRIRRNNVWTATMVLAGIKALSEAGLPLNVAHVQRDTSESTSEILDRALGITTTVAALFKRASIHFGSWDRALQQAGLDPRNIRRRAPPAAWTGELVLKVIELLHQNGIRLNWGAILDMNPDDLNMVLEPLSLQTTPGALIEAAQKFFGSWPRALISAGLDANAVRVQGRWSKEKILNLLARLVSAGHPVNYKFLQKDPAGVITSELSLAEGRTVRSRHLISASQRFFGSYENALKAGGHCSENSERSRRQKVWTPAMVIEGLKSLAISAIPMNAAHIRKDTSRSTSTILRETLGIETTAAALADRALYYFGTWDDALRSAGLEPRGIRRRATYTKWSPQLVVDAIRHLAEYGMQLDRRSLSTVTEIDLDLAFAPISLKPSPGALVEAARRYYGSWSQALTASGFDAKADRLEVQWSKETVVRLINRLASAGHPINFRSLKNDHSGALMMELSLAEGRLVRGRQLLWAAHRYFGSYGNALRAAGLNPQKVRVWPAHRQTFSPTQVTGEWVTDGDAQHRFSRYLILGDPPKDQQEELESSEAVVTLKRVIGELSESDQRILEVVLEVIDEIGFDSVAELGPVIASRLQLPITEGQIQSIFARLATDSRLHHLRDGKDE